jgi:hypothetical protein
MRLPWFTVVVFTVITNLSPSRPDQMQGLGAVDEPQLGERHDAVPVERGLEREVEWEAVIRHDPSQIFLLPEPVDDYVGADNPVRFFDAFDGMRFDA